MIITKELLLNDLKEQNLNIFIALGMIIARELMNNNIITVGFNILDELQIDDNNVKVLIPNELKEKSIIELGKILIEKGFNDEQIITILENLNSPS